jgi:hypothetical protein
MAHVLNSSEAGSGEEERGAAPLAWVWSQYRRELRLTDPDSYSGPQTVALLHTRSGNNSTLAIVLIALSIALLSGTAWLIIKKGLSFTK